MTTDKVNARNDKMCTKRNMYYAFRQSFLIANPKYCACGCGETLPPRPPYRHEKQQFLRGHENRGRKLTPQQKAKRSQMLKGVPHPGLRGVAPWDKGLHLPMETRVKLSVSVAKVYNTPEMKDKMRRVQLRVQRSKEPTDIESLVRAELDARELRYERNKVFYEKGFGCVADFYLPEHNIVLEIDGCYSHGCIDPECPVGRYNLKHGLTPRMKHNLRRDKAKDAYYHSKGLQVKRAWGHDVLRQCRETVEGMLREITVSVL